MWAGTGILQRRRAEEKSTPAKAKSQAFQRLSQAHERFGTKDFIDSNMVAEKFSETERNRGKADSGKEEQNRATKKLIETRRKRGTNMSQQELEQEQEVNGERVGERLRGARSPIQPSSSSPLLGPAAAAAACRSPIQPSSRSTPTAGGIHTTNGPHARLSL